MKVTRGQLSSVWSVTLIAAVVCLAFAPAARAERRPATGQVFIGMTVFDEDELDFMDAVSVDGSRAHADIAKMPMVGLAGQLPLNKPGAFDFGVESGVLIGCASDSDRAPADNAKGVVTVDVDWRITDLFFGLFLRSSGCDTTRVYAGAGPMLLLGRLHRDAIEGNPAWYTFEEERSEGIFGYGAYGRAGIEFNIENGWLGVGVRGMLGEMTFGGDTDDVDVRALQGMLTYSSAW
ncbi:MAG: hypothetical protein PHR35_17075 [Kiritimatiellae bacterium]|nr:hypothetical protein [Kiritimatiellia bacterium]